MLDLRELKAKAPYQMRLENGTVLDIKLPTQALLVKMIQLENYEGGTADVLDELFEITTDIFNNNTNNLTFTLEDIKSNYDFTICSFIIQDYLQEVSKNLGEC